MNYPYRNRAGLAAVSASVLLFALLGLFGCGGDSNVDVTAPAVTLAGLSANTTSPDRQLTGTVEAGAEVVATVGTTDFPATVTGTTWSCDLTLVPGVNTVKVRAADAAGNSQTLNFFLTYDALTLDVFTTPIAAGSETIGGLIDPALVGTLTLGVTLVDGTTVNPVPVVVDDTWTANLTGLQEGTAGNLVTVSVIPAGQTTALTGTQKIIVDSTAPGISIAGAGIVKMIAPGKVVTGTLEPNNPNLVLSPQPAELAPVIDQANGIWSATFPALAVGKNSIVATLTGLGGVIVTTRSLIIVEQLPPLVVRQISPVEGATGVAVNEAVTARFSAAMDASTLTPTSFSLAGGLGAVTAGVSYDAPSQTATLTPGADLAAGTTYTATLSTDITDANGTKLPQTVSWSFTTAP